MRLLSSPRRRRRLLWAAALAACCGGVASVVLLVHTHTNNPEVIRPGKPQVVQTPSAVHPVASEVARMHAVAVRFIATAVRRRHVDDSWAITDSTLKAGMTRSEWAKGDIPAPPFPADTPRYAPYKLLYSYPGQAALVFGLLPEHGHPDYRPTSFTVELVKHHGRWLVSSFTPAAASSLQEIDQRSKVQAEVAGAPAPDKAALSATWLVVPLVLLGILLVGVVLVLVLRAWYRRSRSARAWARHSSRSSSNPRRPARGRARAAARRAGG